MNPSGTEIRLLMVDDETEFLAAASRALARRGLKVTQAPNGQRALEVLEREMIDVVVLDVRMPGLDGEALFEIIKRRWPFLPVIMLTGHGTIPQAFRTSKAGLFNYLAKPVEMDQLAEVVKAAQKERPKGNQLTTRESPEVPPQVRLLLVDDEPELLSSLSKVLGRRGIKVSTASSGDEALELLKNTTVDVALLDMKMPGMTGLELLTRMRTERPEVAVLILTGHPTIATAMEGVRMGALDYLLKPQDPDVLAERIREAQRTQRSTLSKRPPESSEETPSPRS